MAEKQSLIQAITHMAIEATKATIMAVKVAENQENTAKLVQVMPRLGNLALQQPAFDWKATDKCQEQWNYEIEVKTISW